MAASVIQSRDPDRAAAAHLVRRTSLAVHPERVKRLAETSWDDAVSTVLAEVGQGGEPPRPAAGDEWTETVEWWIDRMAGPDGGLVDRMAWFWHGLLTTNAYKVSDNGLLARQLHHFRTEGTGNFRALLRGFVTGGALLEYLDASWSIASNPNENLARELMELFTVGRGHYDQDDVRAAARALAGWVVEDGTVDFRRENAFIAPLIFLGRQADWDTDLIVDRLCDHPATAARIGARTWRHLVGTTLAEDRAADLGRWWQDRELEIMPLLERILTDPGFAKARLTRPRTGLEWYCGVRAALGFGDETWYLEDLGQMPYLPPSVAGWPDDDRWLAPGSLLARASFVHSVDMGPLLDAGHGPGTAATTEEILDRCSLFEVSERTSAAIDGIRASDDLSPESVRLARWRVAVTSPEFNLL